MEKCTKQISGTSCEILQNMTYFKADKAILSNPKLA